LTLARVPPIIATRMPQVARSMLKKARMSHANLVRAGVFRLSVAHFLVALVVLFLSLPFVEEMPAGRVIQDAMLTVVLTSAVFAVGGRRRTVLVWAVVLLAPALAGRWIDRLFPELLHPAVTATASLAFVAFVIAQLFAFIFRATRVDSEVLCAGVASYLMLALLWANAYVLAWDLDPHSFGFTAGTPPAEGMKIFNSIYFSMITLSTVGYGDIVPFTRPAKTLAMMEAMTGTIYIAVIISRLVAMYTMSPPREGKPSA
jgi:Ion channel